MGEVYRARDLRLGRDIALKVLPETFAREADRLAHFEREARTMASLNHPNIVTLHSVEDVDAIRFLTMELIEGQSLADLITPGGAGIGRAPSDSGARRNSQRPDPNRLGGAAC
jgi:serine/threonine protein kinase